ncbi:hypothetical protein [Psychrobacter sp. I-STPA6b]|uniref:hypothetical protein n=1 Tax=Psychrobacter sp. I-STPA6b TaxID=2585718 RepID=UPI001D0C3EDC|nr:hypothetical protein [Psychrobacter sp. I-STPA6b]
MSALSSRTIMAIAIAFLLLVIALLYGCVSSQKQAPSATNSQIPKTATSSPENNSPTLNSPNQQQNENPVIPPNNTPAITNEQIKSQTPSFVRPEVRHLIQKRYSDNSELQSALAGAAILQSYLDNPSQDAVAISQRYDCTTINLTQSDQNLIKSLTFDTPERMQTFKNGLANYIPPVSTEISIDSQGNAINPCQNVIE